MGILKHIFISVLILSVFSSNTKLFSQVKMYKYPGNPVFFGGGVDDWDYRTFTKAVIYDNGLYHMWYFASDIDRDTNCVCRLTGQVPPGDIAMVWYSGGQAGGFGEGPL